MRCRRAHLRTARFLDLVIHGATNFPITVNSALDTPALTTASSNEAFIPSGNVVATANDLTITPVGNSSGQSQLTVTLTDGPLSFAEIFNVTVIGLPSAPDQLWPTTEKQPLTFNVLDQALGDGLVVTNYHVVNMTGNLTSNGNGSFTYDPAGQLDTLNVGDSFTNNFHLLTTCCG